MNGPLKGEGEEAMDCKQLEVSVNRVSVVNLEELAAAAQECSVDEQSGM